MFFWLLVGVVLGYLLKPQIDKLLGKVVKSLRDDRDKRYYD